MGREEDARNYLEKVVKEIPNDPYLLEFIQMIQAQMQQDMMQRRSGGGQLEDALLGRNPPSRGANAPTPSAGSGLWTPGQPTGGPAETKQSEGSGSGSGLWLPGQ